MTARQSEIARMLAAGLTVKEVGQVLGVALSTAESHVEAIARKLPGQTPPIRRILRWWLLNRPATPSRPT